MKAERREDKVMQRKGNGRKEWRVEEKYKCNREEKNKGKGKGKRRK